MEPLCLGDGVFRRSKVPRFQIFSRSKSGEPGREGTDGTWTRRRAGLLRAHLLRGGIGKVGRVVALTAASNLDFSGGRFLGIAAAVGSPDAVTASV